MERLEEELKDSLNSKGSKWMTRISSLRCVPVPVEMKLGYSSLTLHVMYRNYSRKQTLESKYIKFNESGIGGFKELVFMVSGQGAYSRFKYESGVHRVQRIPATESGGRIHTSTITVAIMPEVEDVEVEIDMNDCKF